MSVTTSRKHSGIRPLHLLVGLLAAVVSIPAFAQSNPYPTYVVGANQNGMQGPTYPLNTSYPWVAGNGQFITPAGTQVYLGITTRAKAVALNPNTATHTAAVLQMGAPQAVTIFNTQSGKVLQTYSTMKGTNSDGSHNGITYTPDGLHLLFSQDGSYGPSSYVAVANVDPVTGLLSDGTQVKVPIDVTSTGALTTVTCFPGSSPPGTTGSFALPCGYSVSIFVDDTFTSYPLGIATSPDGKTAYAVLDNNNTLTKIDLTQTTPVQGAEVRVGNVPHSVVISPDGKTAYVSNEAGRVPTADDFQGYSNGTPVVAAWPTGATATGTVSVVNLSTFTVTGTISTGLHPTGMALWNNYLLVANTYDDTLSAINTANNQVAATINLGLPISVPGSGAPAYGAGPNSIAVDSVNNIAYVALYNANAIAVVNLGSGFCPLSCVANPVMGMIPTGYAPSSVVLDTADGVLLVANDKGIGTTGFGVAPPPMNTYENSYANEGGAVSFNTHQDLGTVSIVPIPNPLTLTAMTQTVFENNHWDLTENIASAAGGNPGAAPVAIPAKIGAPSKIQHVFVIIKENRTYDQILGDVAAGNGAPSLAVFGNNSTYSPYPVVTPNAHAMVQRFPLLDNFYNASRQSADGHNWITQAIAPYSDDIQSPDWLRDYPSNGGDSIAYQKKGFLWDIAAAAGVTVKNYGEYIESNTFTVPGCTPNNKTQPNGYNGAGSTQIALPFIVSDSCEPTWTQFYNDALLYEAGKEPQLQYFNTIGSVTALPNLYNITVPNYPQFDLGIPDQYRVDVWQQDFASDVANGSVPQLEFLWIMSDHTTGPPNAAAEVADNDLAVGRVVDIISHSNVWSSSAIFIEEDDAQYGVDHVDGHRSPGFVISPYVKQKVNSDGTGAGVIEDNTFYTQVNMTRTIEQILGLTPMNQFDLVASPMTTLFINNPPKNNFLPWTHLPNQVPLCYGVAGYTAPANIPPSINTCSSGPAAPQEKPRNERREVKALRAGWLKLKQDVFAAKYHTPDALDPDTVRHFDWYEATGYSVPFPGEKKVRPAKDFRGRVHAADADDDDK